MARIGLIEIKARNHELSGLCKISQTKNHKITVFTTRELFPYVEEELDGKTDGYEWVLNKEDERTYSYLKRIEKICNERIDLVIIKSIRDWEFAFFNPKCKVLAFIDNLNHWFRDTKSLLTYFRKLLKYKKHITSMDLMSDPLTAPIARRIILSHLDGVIVEYPPFKQYILDNFNYKGKLYFIPNRPFEGAPRHQINTNIRFVVPGMIQEIRRDYEVLMKVFGRLFPKYRESIGLDLVGEPVGDYGRRIISQCEDFRRCGFNVFYPREYVPYSVVREKLAKADVIISPMQVRYQADCIEEIYTITKPSGIFSDVIPYAKPCVVPHTYNVTDKVKTSFLTYKDEDELEGLLESLIVDRDKRQKLHEEALKNSKKFSLEILQEAFDNMVEELL